MNLYFISAQSKFSYFACPSIVLQMLEDPVASTTLLKSISRYAGNVLGTPGYWARRKDELTSLCEQSPPHLWFTLSAADLHWADLKQHLPSESTSNPHLTDSYFALRVSLFIKHHFKTMKTDWIWWRTEYQSRGAAHVHGCVRLSNFPNLHELYETARRGHVIGCTFEDEMEAAAAEQALCDIHDRFCSAQALDPEPDSHNLTRDAPIYPDVHPCRHACSLRCVHVCN